MKNYPLIDLHCHLDGSITPEIALRLAEIQGIQLEQNREKLENLLSVPESCESLNDFLKCFVLPCSLLQTEEAITEAVYLVQENIRSQGVVYLEIRFAPQLHCEKGLCQEQVIRAALRGLEKSSLRTNLILCLMRSDSNRKENMETVELAKKFLVEDGGVTAIDIAGAEALFATGNFREEFTLAKDLEIPFTIHAGEADGPDSVRAALDFGASRIGHGVRIIQDRELLDEVIRRGIPLEMCPNSNRQTKAVADMRRYPLQEYLSGGAKVVINTDDMAICRTTLRREFEYIEKEFGITDSQIRTMLNNAADAAFTGPETKAYLRDLIAAVS